MLQRGAGCQQRGNECTVSEKCSSWKPGGSSRSSTAAQSQSQQVEQLIMPRELFKAAHQYGAGGTKSESGSGQLQRSASKGAKGVTHPPPLFVALSAAFALSQSQALGALGSCRSSNRMLVIEITTHG